MDERGKGWVKSEYSIIYYIAGICIFWSLYVFPL